MHCSTHGCAMQQRTDSTDRSGRAGGSIAVHSSAVRQQVDCAGEALSTQEYSRDVAGGDEREYAAQLVLRQRHDLVDRLRLHVPAANSAN
jgi:hypothetical protein